MNQIRFRLELCPRPHWGSLQRSLAGFKGPPFKGGEEQREGRASKGRGKARKGDLLLRREEGRGKLLLGAEGNERP